MAWLNILMRWPKEMPDGVDQMTAVTKKFPDRAGVILNVPVKAEFHFLGSSGDCVVLSFAKEALQQDDGFCVTAWLTADEMKILGKENFEEVH